jgi:hypothetical protein
MGKKCTEEFNPWPPFVDIFSSTILVLLLFMLILIVNLGYYAQFKFKVSYSGTIATKKIIVEDTNSNRHVTEKLVKKELVDATIVKSSVISEIQEEKNLERAGQDLVQEDDSTNTKQAVSKIENSLIVNFSEKEIILDDVIISEIKKFILETKKKFPKHKIILSSFEPTNQISATVGKQISLARTLNVRNLIRKLNYKKSDVRIRLLNSEFKKKLPTHESGYIFIYVKVKN